MPKQNPILNEYVEVFLKSQNSSIFLISAFQIVCVLSWASFPSSLISTEHVTTNAAQRCAGSHCGEEVRGSIPDSLFSSRYAFSFSHLKRLGLWETLNHQEQQVMYEMPCFACTPISVGSREIIKMCSGFFSKLLMQHSRWMITFCPIT